MTNLKLIILSVMLLFSKIVTAQITSAAPYCDGGYDDMMGFAVPHYISNVSFGTLTNNTGTVQFPGLHYAYYNTIAAPSLTQGTGYPLSIMHDGGASIHFVAVYIDFNHNNSFADPGERVLQQTIATGGTITNPATTSVTIPLTATVGVTRMRVMVFEDDEYTWTGGATNATPCTPDATGLLDWGETEDYNINIVSSSGSCSPVTGLAASSITSSGATISWTAATGATGYEWNVTTSATPPASGTPITATTTPSGTLTPATTYYAYVRTACGSSYSTWVSVPFTTLSTGPSCPAVTGLTATAITGTNATINWSAATGSLGYQYVINTTVTDPTGSGTNTTATTANATTLTAGTTYYAHVRDSCGAGNFSAWTTVPFTTLSPSCNAPTGLAVTSITKTSAIVNWILATGTIRAQWIVNTTAADPTVAGASTTSSSYLKTGLAPGTLYYLHVRDSCAAGLSAWVTQAFTTLSPTGISNLGSSDFDLTAFPNPAKDAITINVTGTNNNGQLMLTDIAGNIIQTMAVNSTSTNIDMSNLPAGIYLIRYMDAEHSKNIRISKQ